MSIFVSIFQPMVNETSMEPEEMLNSTLYKAPVDPAEWFGVRKDDTVLGYSKVRFTHRACSDDNKEKRICPNVQPDCDSMLCCSRVRIICWSWCCWCSRRQCTDIRFITTDKNNARLPQYQPSFLRPHETRWTIVSCTASNTCSTTASTSSVWKYVCHRFCSEILNY